MRALRFRSSMSFERAWARITNFRFSLSPYARRVAHSFQESGVQTYFSTYQTLITCRRWLCRRNSKVSLPKFLSGKQWSSMRWCLPYRSKWPRRITLPNLRWRAMTRNPSFAWKMSVARSAVSGICSSGAYSRGARGCVWDAPTIVFLHVCTSLLLVRRPSLTYARQVLDYLVRLSIWTVESCKVWSWILILNSIYWKIPKETQITDKSTPNILAQLPEFAGDSRVYRGLLEMEKKLDWTMNRKKTEVQDVLACNHCMFRMPTTYD